MTRLPSVTFGSFGPPDEKGQEEQLIALSFDPSKARAADALAVRPKIAAAIRTLTLIDDFAQALAEYAIRDSAAGAAREEKYGRTG